MRTLLLATLLATLPIALATPAAVAGPGSDERRRIAQADLDHPRGFTERRAHRRHLERRAHHGHADRRAHRGHADRRAHRGVRTAQLDDKRARVRQRLRELRAARLTAALELDEQTAARLFPVLERYDERFARLTGAHADSRAALRRALERRPDDAAAIDALIDEMLAQQRALFELQEQRYRDVRRLLTAEQAARLLLVLPELDRRIHRETRRFGQEGGDRPRRRGRGHHGKGP